MTSKAFFQKVLPKFCSLSSDEFRSRIDKWPVDLSRQHIHEVIGALLARQVALAQEMAKNPSIWIGHTAPLILRAMADAHITLVWLLISPDERCRQFILYGLGQEKLRAEHLKVQAKEANSKAIMTAAANLERWIEAQRSLMFTDVNLGSWSSVSTRQMAKEANCEDFYNFVYTPFSSAAHSSWAHLARYNLGFCNNPLHGLHRVPGIKSDSIDANYLYLAAKYMNKSFSSFDIALGTISNKPSAFAFLSRKLEKLRSRAERTQTGSAK